MADVAKGTSVFDPFLVGVKRAILLHSSLFYAVSPVGNCAEKGDWVYGFRGIRWDGGSRTESFGRKGEPLVFGGKASKV